MYALPTNPVSISANDTGMRSTMSASMNAMPISATAVMLMARPPRRSVRTRSPDALRGARPQVAADLDQVGHECEGEHQDAGRERERQRPVGQAQRLGGRPPVAQVQAVRDQLLREH